MKKIDVHLTHSGGGRGRRTSWRKSYLPTSIRHQESTIGRFKSSWPIRIFIYSFFTTGFWFIIGHPIMADKQVRHLPALILPITEIPYTVNGKKVMPFFFIIIVWSFKGATGWLVEFLAMWSFKGSTNWLLHLFFIIFSNCLIIRGGASWLLHLFGKFLAIVWSFKGSANWLLYRCLELLAIVWSSKGTAGSILHFFF